MILDSLADGMTEADLPSEYRQLTHQDVMAAIAYGAPDWNNGRRRGGHRLYAGHIDDEADEVRMIAPDTEDLHCHLRVA